MPKPSITAENYLVDGNFDLFVGVLDTAPASTPPVETVAVSGAATTGDVTLGCSATSIKLYEGQRILFGSQHVFLTADAEIGATSLSVQALTADIADLAEGTTYAMKPIYAVDTISRSTADRNLELENSDVPAGTSHEIMLGHTFSRQCTANVLINQANEGLDIIKTAGRTNGRNANIYYEIIDSEGVIETGLGLIKNLNEGTIQINQVRKFSWEMRVQGSITDLIPA